LDDPFWHEHRHFGWEWGFFRAKLESNSADGLVGLQRKIYDSVSILRFYDHFPPCNVKFMAIRVVSVDRIASNRMHFGLQEGREADYLRGDFI